MFIIKHISFIPLTAIFLFFLATDQTEANKSQTQDTSVDIEVVCKRSKLSGFNNGKFFPKQINFSSQIFPFLEEFGRVSTDVTGWDVYSRLKICFEDNDICSDINFTLRDKNKLVGTYAKGENDATHRNIYAEYRCKPDNRQIINHVVNSFQTLKQKSKLKEITLAQQRLANEKLLNEKIELERQEREKAEKAAELLALEIEKTAQNKIAILEKERKAKEEAKSLAQSLAEAKEQEQLLLEAKLEAERLARKEAEEIALKIAEQRKLETENLKAKLEIEKIERQEAQQAAEILSKFKEQETKTLNLEIANEQKAKLDAIYSATSSSVSMTNTASEQTVRVSASASKWQNASSPEEAQAFANDIQASIVMFMAIAEVIEKQPPTLKDRVLGIVTSEIKRLQSEKELLQAQLTNRFSTPIRPTNANLSVSAFRAADTFPKIPFYVPGTNEIGEMLVVPRITDEGYLQYQFDFLDPTATYDKVRDSISIEHKNVDLMIGGLQKVDEWTLVAQENGVTRRVEKTSACIPDGACENKVQGVSSTEVVFQIYEDGSTAGRIQRNKGQFSTGYNMSVESSILLSAYLTYMRDVGSKEFNIGVMTDDEVKDLFQ